MHNFLREGRREREPPTRLDVGRTLAVLDGARRKSRIFSSKEAITRATDFARPPPCLPASLCSCPSRVLHHQETAAAAVSFQLLLRNDMDGRTDGRTEGPPADIKNVWTGLRRISRARSSGGATPNGKRAAGHRRPSGYVRPPYRRLITSTLSDYTI